MQVSVPSSQATHLSFGLGVPTAAMSAPAFAVAPQSEVGFMPDHRKTMKKLSALQIVVGILCIVIYVILLAIGRWNLTYSGVYPDYIGAGIWCGILYITAGSLGVTAVRQNRLAMIISAMVGNILSSLLIWIVLVMAANSIEVSVRKENCMINSYNGRNSYSYPCMFYDFGGYKAADSFLIILSVVELIISIWYSVLCCKGLRKACSDGCCYGDNYGYHPQPMHYTQAHSAGQQVIFAPQAGVAGGHANAFMPTQPYSYTGTQPQPLFFTLLAAPGAAVIPPSSQSSLAGPPEYQTNETGNAASGNTANRRLEVKKDQMAERC